MSRLFYHVMQDNAGNLLFDVSGTMRLAGSGTVATIYGDEALTVILPNPMTNHPSFGSFKCFLGAGDYDFYMAKAGYTFETLTGVQGHGTMAQQDASAVTIGALTVSGDVVVNGSQQVGRLGIARPADPTHVLILTGSSRHDGRVGVNATPLANAYLSIDYPKATPNYGLVVRPNDSDTGTGQAILFLNLATSIVGGISTTGAATAYNTTSDARVKHDVTNLVGELAVLEALRPVRFKWNVDNSDGVGFLAHEVAAHVQGVITGEAGAVDEAGGIVPQMIDMSKLVPWLVGALKTLAARVAVLEDALGI